MKRISFIAISGILIFSASSALAYEFSGPTQGPTQGNTPGVIWNVDGTTAKQPNAKINFGNNSDGSGHPGGANYLSDIGLADGKMFRVDKVGASTFNMGNFVGGWQPFTFGVYGDIKMYSFGGLAGQKGRMDAVEYCINGASCITDWPSGGGGGVSTISVGSGLTVTNPTGPTATISLSSSCAANQILKWNGSSWVCSADNNTGGTLTGITAGTGATISGAAPSPTINVTDLYVNTTGDYMSGQLSLTANNTQTGGSLYAESTAPATYTNCDSAPSACGAKGKGKEAGVQGIGRVGVWGIGNDYGATGRAISGGYFSNLSGTINASIGTPIEAIKAQGQISATNFSGWGGYFWGSYGVGGRGYGTNAHAVDAYIGSDVTNGYAGYFDAQNALGTSYGLYVRGPSTGPAGRFVDAGTNRAVELASQSTNLALSVAGNTRLGGATNDTTTVSGTLTLIAPSSRLCLGTVGGVPDCRTYWPSGGSPGGANTQIQYNNNGAFGGSPNFVWDNANNRLTLNAYTYFKAGGTSGYSTHLPYTDGVNYIRGKTVIADGATTELVGIGTSSPTEKLSVNGNVNLTSSNKGIILDAQNSPLITRGFAAFTSGAYSGLGRYGLFLETSNLISGIPTGAKYTVTQYNADSTKYMDLMTVQSNIVSVPTGTALYMNGAVSGNNGGIGINNVSNSWRWWMGTGNSIEIYAANKLANNWSYYMSGNGSFTASGTTSELRFTDRVATNKLWSLYSNNGWAYLYNTTYGNRFAVKEDGDVYVYRYLGIGTSAPSYQLQLSLNSAAKPTSNVWTVASDSRLKDIQGNYAKGLNEIIQLNPIIYSYKKNNPYNYPSNTIGQGAIAQEVQKVFPEAVTEDAKGYLQLDTNSISWASINAIKELKAENDKLKTQNASLEWRLRTLEAKVDSLMK